MMSYLPFLFNVPGANAFDLYLTAPNPVVPPSTSRTQDVGEYGQVELHADAPAGLQMHVRPPHQPCK